MVKPLLSLILFFCVFGAFAQNYSFNGNVRDAYTSELLIGASVRIDDAGGRILGNVSTGLNGFFRFDRLPAGNYTVSISMEGYESFSERINISGNVQKSYSISSGTRALDEIQVSRLSRGTDAEARSVERLSPNVINIISARQIELSPDITVANVVQRVSGLSIERNANGDPQYAVVRGMNKRYNNTLVNGIKIPSPDNDNRFVPLDIFPAVFLEKLTVSKSLSADMEADAIGGTIDMVMKSAPSNGRIFEFDFQSGANVMNFDGEFTSYDRSEVYRQSPAERYGRDYEAVMGDFSNLLFETKPRPLADILASASYGQRFLDNKLGLLIGGSLQNSYRPNDNYFYDPTVLTSEGNPLRMNELIIRRTSTQQQRMAFHAKLDYDVDTRNSLSLYGGQYMLNEFRVREQYLQDNFVAPTGYNVYPATRITNTYQTISIANLSGKHILADRWKLDWSGVYSLAKNELPDDAIFARRTARYDSDNQEIIEETLGTRTGSHNSRRWEWNQDNDLALYLNATYKTDWISALDQVKVGGMFRNKTRDNHFINYRYRDPIEAVGFRWQDWYYFGDIPFDGLTDGYGDGDGSNLIYDADETVIAYYANTNWKFAQWHVQAGLRAEHTEQGYFIDNSVYLITTPDIDDRQKYFNLFPSVSLKYALNEKTWLKSTYYKGISRPGFYEIVPTNRSAGGGDSFYHERGNPDLRPTIGHNFDLRYELFPNALDQLLAGVFYKRLIDPIEYGFPQVENTTERPSVSRILPQNFGTANNFGVELDYTKYFREFGVRMNYTYTNSTITTNKVVMSVEGSQTNFALVNEKRPLQGQSDHIGNVSLLYKNIQKQWDAQLVLNYTGKRLAVVSPFEGADQYMRPMSILDLSVEKGFNRFVVFLKANNLLDTPYQLIVNKPIGFSNDYYPYQEDPTNIGNVRRDLYGQSFRLGVRFKL